MNPRYDVSMINNWFIDLGLAKLSRLNDASFRSSKCAAASSMGRRQTLISSSILKAIFLDRSDDNKTLLGRILAFFSIFQLTLSRYKADLFRKLRTEVWQIDDNEYIESFKGSGKKAVLKAVGDLGYSGSVNLLLIMSQLID